MKRAAKSLPLIWACGAACAAAMAGLIIGKASGQQAATASAPVTQTAPGSAPAAARGGRGGVPNGTAGQNAAVAQMNADLAELTQKLTTARAEVLAAAMAWPRDDARVKKAMEGVMGAEYMIGEARAEGLAKIQASANKLTAAQLTSLGGGRAAAVASPGVPKVTSNQVRLLTELTGAVQPKVAALTGARTEALRAAFAEPRDDVAMKKGLARVIAAESDLADTRADGLAKIQATPDKLSTEQLTALVAQGGVITSGGFSEPMALNFNDHEGYVSLFDGKTLKGWDGHPKFWRVEDGAIIGESTPQNPSGNSYLAYKDIEAKDFTLKFEIKVEGQGGSGIQYRSKTGVPWLSGIAGAVTANAGPTNLNWMMTGPQADFWPSKVYTGQFYSENTPMRIMAWRGQVVEGYGMGPRRLMGTIGGRDELGKVVKGEDWNEYTVIARGGTFIHIVNGQLMAVMVDDDPTSSNNQSGKIGIEIEATTKIFVRNIWLKKLN